MAKRRYQAVVDIDAAQRHLDLARYVARIAQIGPRDADSAALRRAALANDDRSRAQPARMVLKALDDAEAAMTG
jgi:hypothetical protein